MVTMMQGDSSTKCSRLRYRLPTRTRHSQKKSLRGFKFPFKQCAVKLVSFQRKLYSALTNLKNFNNQTFSTSNLHR